MGVQVALEDEDPLVLDHVADLALGIGQVPEEERAGGTRLDAGGDDILTKPINKLELLTRVRSLLRIRALTIEIQEQRRFIHDLLKTYVSAESAQRYLADPTGGLSLEPLKPPS